TSTPACGLGWNSVYSPNVGANDNKLNAVAAISTNDAWAVGSYSDQQFAGPNQTLTEHWDGSAWSVVPSGNPGASDDVLLGVAAVSPDDVWAVGYYYDGSSDRT